VAALIGAGTVALAALAARRIAGDRVGIATAVVVALWPGFWLYEWALLSEVLLLPLLALLLLVTYRFVDEQRTLDALGMGVLIGLLALTRSEQVLLAPLVVAPALLGATGATWRRRTARAAVAGAAALLVVA